MLYRTRNVVSVFGFAGIFLWLFILCCGLCLPYVDRTELCNLFLVVVAEDDAGLMEIYRVVMRVILFFGCCSFVSVGWVFYGRSRRHINNVSLLEWNTIQVNKISRIIQTSRLFCLSSVCTVCAY